MSTATATGTQDLLDLNGHDHPQPEPAGLIVTEKAAQEVKSIVGQQRQQCLSELVPDLVAPFDALATQNERPPTLTDLAGKLGLTEKDLLIKLGTAAYAKPGQLPAEFKEAYQAFNTEKGKAPTSAELAEKLNMPEADLLHKIGQAASPIMGTVYLRVSVVGGGCSGFKPKLDLDPAASDKTDEIFEIHGVPVAINRRSMMYLQGAIVDFHSDLNRRGFSVTNPSAKSTCGCGSSFSM